MDLFFIDYDLVPLLVQENYLSSAEKTGDLEQLKRIHRAADSIARGDIANLLIRKDQNWKLLDTFGFNSSLYPAHLVANFCPFAQFPQFYGKFSSERKMLREIKELSSATMGAITGTRESIKFDYGPAILNMLKYHMKKGSEDSIDQAFTVYENYGLTPDLVKEHLLDIIFNPMKVDLMDGIDTKVKTALTRMYNNRYKDSIKVKKKKQAVVDDGKLGSCQKWERSRKRAKRKKAMISLRTPLRSSRPKQPKRL
jgi:replication factor C subunit 1